MSELYQYFNWKIYRETFQIVEKKTPFYDHMYKIEKKNMRVLKKVKFVLAQINTMHCGQHQLVSVVVLATLNTICSEFVVWLGVYLVIL